MSRSRVVLVLVVVAVVVVVVTAIVSQRRLVAGTEAAWSVDGIGDFMGYDDERVLITDDTGARVLGRETGQLLQRVTYADGDSTLTALLVPEGVVSYGSAGSGPSPRPQRPLAFHVQPEGAPTGDDRVEPSWTVPAQAEVNDRVILGLDVDAGVLAYYESGPEFSSVRGIALDTGATVWEQPLGDDDVLVPSLPRRGGLGSDPVATTRFLMPAADDGGSGTDGDQASSLRSTATGEELNQIPDATGWLTDRMLVEVPTERSCTLRGRFDGAPVEVEPIDAEECRILTVSEPDTAFVVGSDEEADSARLYAVNLAEALVTEVADSVDLSRRGELDRWEDNVSSAFVVERRDDSDLVVLDSTSAEELASWPVESPWLVGTGSDAVLVMTALPAWRSRLGGADGPDARYLQVRDPRTGDSSGRLVLERTPWSGDFLDDGSAIIMAEGTVYMLRI